MTDDDRPSCVRCGRYKGRLREKPYGDDDGTPIVDLICPLCWQLEDNPPRRRWYHTVAWWAWVGWLISIPILAHACRR